MIECNPLTLKASSLNNRRSERPADMSEMITSTLRSALWDACVEHWSKKGSPSMLMGHPIGVHVSSSRPGGTMHPRFLDKPSERVRVLSGDAFSVLCPACYKGGKL